MVRIYAAETSHPVCNRTVVILPSIKQYRYILSCICVGCSKCACFFYGKFLLNLTRKKSVIFHGNLVQLIAMNGELHPCYSVLWVVLTIQ